jgi:hypothetical protein
LAGEADETLLRRLEAHPDLKAQVQDAIDFDKKLYSGLKANKDAISSMELGEYILGYLSPERAAIIEKSLNESSALRHALEMLETFLAAEQHDTPVDTAPGAGRPSLILHRVEVDEAQLPKVAGDEIGVVHFSAEEIELSLSLQGSFSEKQLLTGQISANRLDEWDEAQVTVTFDDLSTLKMKVDNLGYFEAPWRPEYDNFTLTITQINGRTVHAGPIQF